MQLIIMHIIQSYYTLSNKNNEAELMLLFNIGLSRLINELSLISNKNLVAPWARMAKSSNEESWLEISNDFRFKDRLPYDLVSCVVYKFQCGRCNASYYGETDRHLKVRSGEHIGISPLTFKKVKPSAGSSMRDHLLFCNHDPSFDDFTILAQGSTKFLLEIKESLLIKRDKPILNKNISSAPLFVLDKV